MDLTDANGDTPLIIAAKNGLEEIARLLITNGCDTSTQNKAGLDAFEQSFCSNHIEVQSILSNTRHTDTSDPWQVEMLKECRNGNENNVQHLVHTCGNKTINFRHQKFGYQDAMHVASYCGNLGCCKILRASGAYVDNPDVFGNTPLINSTSVNNLQVVRWLIAQGTI